MNLIQLAALDQDVGDLTVGLTYEAPRDMDTVQTAGTPATLEGHGVAYVGIGTVLCHSCARGLHDPTLTLLPNTEDEHCYCHSCGERIET